MLEENAQKLLSIGSKGGGERMDDFVTKKQFNKFESQVNQNCELVNQRIENVSSQSERHYEALSELLVTKVTSF